MPDLQLDKTMSQNRMADGEVVVLPVSSLDTQVLNFKP